MSIVIRPADRFDVSAAISAISDQSKAELAVAGATTAQAAQAFRIAADRGEAYASERDGEILTLFGFNEFDDHYSMWSIGTKAFFGGGIALVLATRRFFDSLDLDKPLAVVTKAPHPDVDRWLTLLGLRFSSEQDGARIYWLDRPDLH